MQLLEKLVTTPGIPGREEKIRELIKDELNKIADEVKVDSMGNVIGIKKGKSSSKDEAKKVMVAAHMDEIGFLVKHIDKKGFLRLEPLGGFDARALVSQRVIVHGKEELLGNLAPSTKPPHMLSAEEAKKKLEVKDFFVDLGLDGDKVKELVNIGDPVTLKQDFVELGNSYSAKAMDDRIGVYVMLEAAKELDYHEADIYLVATVQEEVGLRGGKTSAFGIDPDVGIALDVTIANDIPGSKEEEMVASLGEGAAIKIMDGASISNYKVIDTLKEIAEDKELSYQMELMAKGGTDAGAMQQSRAGIPTAGISIPTRYVHTVNEMVHKDDVNSAVKLLSEFLKTCHEKDFSL